jgi:hypothetical protein
MRLIMGRFLDLCMREQPRKPPSLWTLHPFNHQPRK